ncbi:MAG: hypothetical protein DI537_20745 [Stutzerimonas stutzeri]|nr:MAG: hypothetical protein DI537_20745 [Stutzerimonas stutzeri]
MSAAMSTEPTAANIDDSTLSAEEAFFGALADEVLAAEDEADISASIAFSLWWDDLPHAQRCETPTEQAWGAFRAGHRAGSLKHSSEGAAP